MGRRFPILLSSLILLQSTITACSTGPEKKKETVGQYIDSSTVTAKVKTALAKERKVSALAINVETYKGTVQLSGFVDTKEQRKLAEEIAKSVEGVLEVENDLIIKED